MYIDCRVYEASLPTFFNRMHDSQHQRTSERHQSTDISSQ